MKIAAAQIKAKIGDIQGNLDKHLEMINLAVSNRVDLIVFPELSLTGYCREEGANLAMDKDNPIIIALKEIADTNNLIIIVGAPVKLEELLYIGSYILIPNRAIELYTKQFLHEGEEGYYSSSFEYNPQIVLRGERIQLAICADVANEQHAINAKENNGSLYVPSIFYSINGIEAGYEALSSYAKNYSMQILMSNYVGDLWGITAAGKSGFWDSNGDNIAALSSELEGLLIMEKKNESWLAQKYERNAGCLQLVV